MRLQFAKDLDTRLHPLLLPSKRCSESEELAPNAVLHFISTMSAPPLSRYERYPSVTDQTVDVHGGRRTPHLVEASATFHSLRLRCGHTFFPGKISYAITYPGASMQSSDLVHPI
jgi:hypothetical protein